MGHYGEALPFWVNRVDCAYRQNKGAPNPEFGPGSEKWASHYVLNNLWVTTSGNYFGPAYYCTRDGIGLDKILLGLRLPVREAWTTARASSTSLGLPEEELGPDLRGERPGPGVLTVERYWDDGGGDRT